MTTCERHEFKRAAERERECRVSYAVEFTNAQGEFSLGRGPDFLHHLLRANAIVAQALVWCEVMDAHHTVHDWIARMEEIAKLRDTAMKEGHRMRCFCPSNHAG